MRKLLTLAVCGALALGAAACGDDDDDDGGNGGGGESLSGTVRADGSSTVAPLTETAAELFQGENPDVRVTVGTSGTSGGFEKFCNGETEISDASRPIKEEEVAICKKNGVEYEEVQVANDALSAVVNPNNPVECMTVEQLKSVWNKGSEVDSWDDIKGLDADVGDDEITLFGPGSDSGTFDYWTEAINGEEGVIRTDYNSIGEDDNAAINGVAGDEWAMAYVPFSFVQEAGEQVKALQIDGGDGCVEPSLETVQDGSYKPLGRPLFIYPSGKALQKPEVRAFIKFYIDNQAQITEQATYIPMTEEQTAASTEKVDSLAAG
ncbi:MAG TPA: PstS family phosphate ABC transporter substrate-binding protein [Thermoleophilaceae bacterium]|nr:PstS family phosphate ABC transporter substrate-binding protein [Thermoleophilaceae bacterium]